VYDLHSQYVPFTDNPEVLAATTIAVGNPATAPAIGPAVAVGVGVVAVIGTAVLVADAVPDSPDQSRRFEYTKEDRYSCSDTRVLPWICPRRCVMQARTPRFHTTVKGDAILLVRCDRHGINISLTAVNPKPGLSQWLATWLAAFLDQKPGYQLNDEATFFYVLVGDIDGASPDLGLVDGYSVLEAAVGGVEPDRTC
jgi:hypothetical protein